MTRRGSVLVLTTLLLCHVQSALAKCTDEAWDETKIDLLWTVVDHRAHARFHRAQAYGASCFDAALVAQGDKPYARETMRKCAERAQVFLEKSGECSPTFPHEMRNLGEPLYGGAKGR